MAKSAGSNVYSAVVFAALKANKILPSRETQEPLKSILMAVPKRPTCTLLDQVFRTGLRLNKACTAIDLNCAL